MDNLNASANFAVVHPHHRVQVSPDPKDDKILEAAIAGEAELIVSGDRRGLLELHPFEGIQILAPADALALLRNVG